MLNWFTDPFRYVWSLFWRFLYLIPSQFDSILAQIFKIITPETAWTGLGKAKFNDINVMIIGGLLICFVASFQFTWNHLLGVDDDSMGQNTLHTTVKKVLLAIILCVVSIRLFTYVDSQFNNIIMNGTEQTKIVDSTQLVNISTNEFLKDQLKSDIDLVKGCENMKNKAEFQHYDTKTKSFTSTAKNEDIYNCFEVNEKFGDLKKANFKTDSEQNNAKKDEIAAKINNLKPDDNAYAFETNPFTLVIIGFCSSVSLIFILINIFKTKFECIQGIIFSPLFASAFISKKSSTWHQFLKTFLGKEIQLIVTVFLLKFTGLFLNDLLNSINNLNHGNNPLFIAIFQCIVAITFFGIVATGSVYFNSFIGQSGATGMSGGQGIFTAGGSQASAQGIKNGTKKAVSSTIGGIKGTAKAYAGTKNGIQKVRNNTATKQREQSGARINDKFNKARDNVASGERINDKFNKARENVASGERIKNKFNEAKRTQEIFKNAGGSDLTRPKPNLNKGKKL